MSTSCPVCNAHVHDGVCPNCGPITKDERKKDAKAKKQKTFPKSGKR